MVIHRRRSWPLVIYPRRRRGRLRNWYAHNRLWTVDIVWCLDHWRRRDNHGLWRDVNWRRRRSSDGHYPVMTNGNGDGETDVRDS